MSSPSSGNTHLGPSSDVTRRTRLADERTFLAWMRTSLSAFAISLGAGKVVPALTVGTKWPYEVLGAGFGLLGLGIVGFGLHRHRTVETALSKGADVEINARVITTLVICVVLLGLILLGIVVWS